jgi:hypothetical protein
MTGRREATLPTLDTRHGDSRRTLTPQGFCRRWGERRNFRRRGRHADIDAHASWSAPRDRNPNGPRPAAGGARARGPLQARALGPGRGRMAAGRQKLRSRLRKNSRAGSGWPPGFRPVSALAIGSLVPGDEIATAIARCAGYLADSVAIGERIDSGEGRAIHCGGGGTIFFGH